MPLVGWKTTFEVIGVAAVFVSFAAGAFALYFGNKVAEIKDERLRQTNNELAAEIARGKEADARIAEAEARAAEANLQLAKLKTPRSLNQIQQVRIAAKIGQFAGTPFDLWVNTDQESANLMLQIEQAMALGRWQLKPPGASIEIANKAGVIADTGVSVIFVEDKGEFEKAALTLANAINDEGIAVKGCFKIPAKEEAANHRDKNNIHILVGAKPLT
jgi:hypothetical protein